MRELIQRSFPSGTFISRVTAVLGRDNEIAGNLTSTQRLFIYKSGPIHTTSLVSCSDMLFIELLEKTFSRLESTIFINSCHKKILTLRKT